MQPIKIFNTLSGKKEDFHPLDPGHIKIYACGPTVYNFAHIGNARMAVVFDTLVRVLRYKYPKVTYVSNITDIDDKIIDAANEQEVPIKTITEKYTNIYNEDMSQLSVNIPDIQPKATEYISEMIDLIENLILKEHAYEKEGHVLFHVPSYKNYGMLSNRNRDEQIAGSRVEIAPFKRTQLTLSYGNQVLIFSRAGILHGGLVGLVGILNVQPCQRKPWDYLLIFMVAAEI